MNEMKYKCLIFDHDDTTVNSTATVHYPAFLAFIETKRPEKKVSLEEYVRYNFEPGIFGFYRDICGLTEAECEEEYRFWMDYCSRHVSDVFPGIRKIMERHRENGGIIAVVSHSHREKILRDYAHNGLPEPDIIFGFEQPHEELKPSPVPVYKIMERFGLKAEEILVIDDLKPGMDMALAAGTDFAAAGWCFDVPENEKALRENADVYCKTVDDLWAYLNGKETENA